MKSMIVFAMVMGMAACVVPSGDESESTAGAKVDPQQKPPAASIPTKAWITTDALSVQENLLWPPGVKSVTMLYRSGPTLQFATTSGVPELVPTYLAFDVADGTVINVFMIETGSSTGSNMKNALNSAFSAHTNQPADTIDTFASVGGGVKGTPPAPTPVIDEYSGFAISAAWQQEAINAAAQINATDTAFSAYVENE